jgi:hypothetical protein
MPRPQFSIRTLLWLTLVVAAFLGGMAFQKERQRRHEYRSMLRSLKWRNLVLMDGVPPYRQEPRELEK